MKIYVFYPIGQVSRLQERQMTTVKDPSVVVHSFEGGGDDMDAPIKTLVTDPVFAKKHGICSLNSVNWGRVCVQTVHYFWCYLRAVGPQGVGQQCDFAIPTGAMGNVAAGMFSRRMGLPIRTLLIGTNANDIAHRTISNGEFHKKDMHKTLSEAINIQVPYNFERFFYYLAGEDSSQVCSWMHAMEEKQELTFSPELRAKLAQGLASQAILDDTMLDAMRGAMAHHRYLVDPHTAVAIAAAQQWFRLDKEQLTFTAATQTAPVVVLSTAHAAKFEEAVRAGLGDHFWDKEMELPASAQAVMAAGETPIDCFQKGEDWTAKLRELIEKKPLAGFRSAL